MEVLQTSPLGLLGTAPDARSITKRPSSCQLATRQVNSRDSKTTDSSGSETEQGDDARIVIAAARGQHALHARTARILQDTLDRYRNPCPTRIRPPWSASG